MKPPVFLAAALLATAAALTAQTYQPTWESVDRRPNPAWFQDAKFGIFIHWGVYSVPAYAPVIPGKLAYAEWYWNAMVRGKSDPAKATPIQSGTWAFHQRMYGPNFDYMDFAPQFKAELYDPEHWASVFRKSGAKYVVLTSKHHEGFTLWPNAQASATWGRPWNAMEIGPKRDLLGDLTQAVRATGLKMGYYYSLYEWFNPLWLQDRKRYIAEHMTPQFKDLVTKYNPSLIFADGEWDLPSSDWKSPELLSWLFNESAVKDEVVVNDRWGRDSRHKHGGYWTTEYTPGMASSDHAWEESRGMGFSYGYNRAERAEHYRSGRELTLTLVDLVSRGGNLLLDIGPDGDGTIPVVMEQRLLEIGDFLRVNGEAIYGTRPWKTSRQSAPGSAAKVEYGKKFEAHYDVNEANAGVQAFFTSKGKDLYAILPAWPPGGRLTLQGVGAVKSASLLGGGAVVTKPDGKNGVSLELAAMPEALRYQPAWTVKLVLR